VRLAWLERFPERADHYDEYKAAAWRAFYNTSRECAIYIVKAPVPDNLDKPVLRNQVLMFHRRLALWYTAVTAVLLVLTGVYVTAAAL